eukprot:CAMPEP_0184741172 /NCGR_PEP_ID=MMETSP0315-20130426/4252_1 /TAXON_ID=101924 /ORGANISM="Rhodosorus marinus, Strain UTEX LB 2760" /LENGTH=810 /DNA_ID=CAMNT_0027211353 /DNA_START=330 /DNA_END=2762 /DNA_ORIENTATION=-
MGFLSSSALSNPNARGKAEVLPRRTRAGVLCMTVEKRAFRQDPLPTIKDFNRRISYHGKRKEFDAALKVKGMIEAAEALDTGIRRNVYTFNAWLDACVRCGKKELTTEAMQEMASLGVKPNIVSFNTILKGFATGQKKDVDNALALLHEMKRLNVEPDILSYNTVLNACAEALEMTTAKKLVVEMLRNDVKPDDFTITTLAKGWMTLKNVEELDKLLLLKIKMESGSRTLKRRKPTAYYTVADGYVRSGRPRKAVALIKSLLPHHREETDGEVFSMLHEIDVAVDVNTFNVLLKALKESAASSLSAQKVLMEMERYDVAPDNITYITLVDLLCANGDMELGEATIASLADSDFPTTAAMYNALIKGYSRTSPPNMEKVFEIYDAMKEPKDGYSPPDHITSACVVDALARVGDVGTALKVLQEAEASEDFAARPRKETFNALIKAYRTAVLKVRTLEEDEFDGDEGADDFDREHLAHYFNAARRILIRMHGFHDERVTPDVITYNTAIDICAELGDVPNAEKLYSEMIADKIRPDVTTFNTLIKACNRARTGLMEAFKWTKEMSEKNVKPDQYTYAGLLSASAESKDVPRALEYFQETLQAKRDEMMRFREEEEESFLQLSVHPSAYVSLMKAFSNLGVNGSKMIFKLRDELEARGYEMGVSGYTAIANCYAQQGDYNTVDATFDEMLRKVRNIPESLNKRQQSIRLKAYCKGNNLPAAVQLFFAERDPDVAMYNTLLMYCCDAKDMDNLVRVLRRMEADGVVPDERTGVSVKEMMRSVATVLKSFDSRFTSLILQAASSNSPPTAEQEAT